VKLWKKMAAALSLGVGCAVAFAAPIETWPDTGPNQWTSDIRWDNGVKVDLTNPLSYTHTISGPGGYTPGTPLSGFRLSIDFSDDASDQLIKGESAHIYLDSLACYLGAFPCTGDLGDPVTWEHEFGPLGATLGLFFDGTLNVGITVSLQDAAGDFMVHRSVLTAFAANQVQVPEPGAIALLAIGLVGAAVATRRKRTV